MIINIDGFDFECEEASGFKKYIGLMFRDKIDKELAMLFRSEKEKIICITTIFIKFPIDILWIDKTGKIVEIHKMVFPWKLEIKPKNKSKYVIELNGGTCDYFGIENGSFCFF